MMLGLPGTGHPQKVSFRSPKRIPGAVVACHARPFEKREPPADLCPDIEREPAFGNPDTDPMERGGCRKFGEFADHGASARPLSGISSGMEQPAAGPTWIRSLPLAPKTICAFPR